MFIEAFQIYSKYISEKRNEVKNKYETFWLKNTNKKINTSTHDKKSTNRTKNNPITFEQVSD